MTSIGRLALLLPTLGCSYVGQVFAGPVYGAVNGESHVGGGVTGHVGLGGSEGKETKEGWVDVAGTGVDVMFRVQGTTRFASFAYGEGFYGLIDMGQKLTGIARADGMLLCNTEPVVLCGGGARGEAVLGVVFETNKGYNPGLFLDEHRRERKLFTIGFFAEYAGYFTRKTELPMIGIEIGYGNQDDMLKTTTGVLLR